MSFTDILESALSTHGLTGASFAYWDGSTLHTAVAGLRNSATGDPVTVDTVMHIGSITKVMNTVLLMQLVDEGRLALEDPVIKYLPELRIRDREALKRITCTMLVNHTSGIDGDWLPERGPDYERIVDAIEHCADLGQLFAPGEATSYCNIATVIAGYLTQKLRGKSWYTLVKERIYEPLEMRLALADVIDAPRHRCSIGDLTDPSTGKMVQSTRPFLSLSFAPAGSTLMTSAGDLVAFARAMLNGGVGVNGARIISAASAARMSVPTATFLTPVQQIGLGWMIAPGGVLTHSGAGPGVHSRLFAHPKSGQVIVLLANCDRGDTLRPAMLDPIVEAWTGIKRQVASPKPGPVDPQPYEGEYESNLQRVEVFARDGGLAMRMAMKMQLYDNSPFGPSANERPPCALKPLGEHAFEGDPLLPGASKTEVRFARPDERGRMRFLGMGARLLARKG
jgi:CubicO group peptidase (beta-lactamase class C family)